LGAYRRPNNGPRVDADLSCTWFDQNEFITSAKARRVLDWVPNHTGVIDTIAAFHASWRAANAKAVVAYALAATRPELVQDLVTLDMLLPGLGLEEVMDCSQGQGLWHFPFHQAEGVAEILFQDRERAYFNRFFTHQAARPGAVSDDDLNAYALAYSGLDRLSAGFGYYRAVFKDGETNRRLAEKKIAIPVLAIGGETGAGAYVGVSFGQVATSVAAEVVPACGHWIADECPEWLSQKVDAVLSFGGGCPLARCAESSNRAFRS
jgi:pimeloyl-ACP methyl ester carboxylesterase